MTVEQSILAHIIIISRRIGFFFTPCDIFYMFVCHNAFSSINIQLGIEYIQLYAIICKHSLYIIFRFLYNHDSNPFSIVHFWTFQMYIKVLSVGCLQPLLVLKMTFSSFAIRKSLLPSWQTRSVALWK